MKINKYKFCWEYFLQKAIDLMSNFGIRSFTKIVRGHFRENCEKWNVALVFSQLQSTDFSQCLLVSEATIMANRNTKSEFSFQTTFCFYLKIVHIIHHTCIKQTKKLSILVDGHCQLQRFFSILLQRSFCRFSNFG